jgi:DNA repair protein RadD
MQLRPYQSRAISELWQWFKKNPQGNPIVSACVGAGKSLMIAEVAKRAMEYPGNRVIVIAHQKELIEQNIAKMKLIDPDADIGVFCAALGRKETGHAVTFATIGSVYKSAGLMGSVQLICADECHLINPKEMGMWRNFIADMRKCGNNRLRVIGWTGTPYRGNGVWLTEGDDPLFTGIAATVTLNELLDNSFLKPLIAVATSTKIDCSNIAIVNGDFKINELSAASSGDQTITKTCLEIFNLSNLHNRIKNLIFCVTIEHAEKVHNELLRLGLQAGLVHGKLNGHDRGDTLKKFHHGEITHLVNIGCLTTGYDEPAIDMIHLLRGSKSKLLVMQMMGRGMRTYEGLDNCLVADFTDTMRELGAIDKFTGRALPPKGNAPTKVCNGCGNRIPSQARACEFCGFEFVFEERVVITHEDIASGAAVLSKYEVKLPPVRFAVQSIATNIHYKANKPDSLCVTFFGENMVMGSCGRWLCFDHDGYAKIAAGKSWEKLGGLSPVPMTTAEAMARVGELVAPGYVMIEKDGKYSKVIL